MLERGRDGAGIRLCQDAHNPVSLSLYASLGFEAKEPLVVIGGTPSGGPAGRVAVRPLTEEDLPACERLHREVHGVSRTNELADALRHPLLEPFVAEREGHLVACAASTAYWPLGHGVAETEDDLRCLLLGAHATTGKPLNLLLPIREASLVRWCLAEGLRVVKPVNLMALGEYHEPRGAWYPSVQY